ncbi:hypothetical protein, conserved [Leishmania tarentolae]|uniref:Uncharacterized protein n=1 Tax=Leishmania tarentolae TaxID=5689 RepID=A0A640KSU4_LEITA|nr:hypothetical protein, conserved [Leishmania tarentolae]
MWFSCIIFDAALEREKKERCTGQRTQTYGKLCALWSTSFWALTSKALEGEERKENMHVEIRLCSVEKACVLDPQSFYRVKQLLSSCNAQSNGAEETARRAWKGGSLLRLRQTTPFTPELKLQVVVERVIEMESRCFSAVMDKKQHEARVKSNWNNSAVGTAYHSANVDEAILAALPAAAADSVVKMRLLQLPPPLDYDAQQVVKRAIGSATTSRQRHDTPLCIGVAKLGLRDLMLMGRTLSIAMQPKRVVVSTVEAHNLDTLITNAMFGRGERNGSAVLCVQFVGYTFERVPRGGLIQSHNPTDTAKHTAAVMEADGRLPSASSGAGGEGAMWVEETLNSATMRFVLLPYVAFVDIFLRVVDITSWRVPRKTGMALAAVVIALYSDLFDMLFVLTVALGVFSVLRNISFFCCVPVSDSTSTCVAVAPAGGTGGTKFQPFLYSRENAFLNSLLRARVFFSRGLMEDTYYELAFAAHIARRNRRRLAGFSLVVCCGCALLSMGTVVILLTLSAFTVYPVFLNIPSMRRRSRRKSLALALFRYAASAIRLPRRYKVVRLVRVAVARAKTASVSPRNNSIAGSGVESVQQQFLNFIRHSDMPNEVPSPTERSENSLKTRERRSLSTFRRTRTMDFDVLPSNSVNFASTLNRFEVTHVMRYFVALCFSPTGMEMSELTSMTSSVRKTSSNAVLQRRLCYQLKQARIISDLLTSSLPQPTSIPTGGSLAAAAQQNGAVIGDSKPMSVSKEIQEAFQSYFNSTLTLLFYLRQQWTFHPYVTHSSTTKCMSDSMRSVTVLAQPQDLIDVGEDDGVTKALMAKRHSMSNPPMVGMFNSRNAVEVSGRVMALYAAYLLQGARLSVYTSSSGCATVIPLRAPGNCMERFPQPNPCPADLLNTLDSVWRGVTSDTAKKGEEVYFNADAVLQIITVYKDYWEGGVNVATTRSPARVESSVPGENHVGNTLTRNSTRGAAASVLPMPRQHAIPMKTTTCISRSPLQSTTALTGMGAAASSVAQPKGDISFRPGSSARDVTGFPLLPPLAASMNELNTMNVIGERSFSSSANAHSSCSKGANDPPVLDATCNRNAYGPSLANDEGAKNCYANCSGPQTVAGKGNTA